MYGVRKAVSPPSDFEDGRLDNRKKDDLNFLLSAAAAHVLSHPLLPFFPSNAFLATLSFCPQIFLHWRMENGEALDSPTST